ncbi:MAG: ABC transporter ATP-binding protein [Oscillospiraceae bacterium]|nr:ABC transporter ATP-binding protein [Oscillospiraceae bacterium]
MSDLVSIKGLSKKVRETPVIKDLTLSIPAGRIIGLLGNNGIGKTTLLRLIGNLQLPDEGEIRIGDKAVSAATAKSTAYLLTPEQLFDWMKVRDAITYFRDFFPDFDEAKARRICEELEIDPQSKIKELSKGNKEKVCLMLAFSRNVKLYLMDEPMGGIDPTIKRNVKKFILENIPEDATVILSTHLIKDMEVLFDQLLIMKDHSVLSVDAEEVRASRNLSVDDYYAEVMSDDGND